MAEQPVYHPRSAPARDKTIGITQRVTPLAFSWVGDMRVR